MVTALSDMPRERFPALLIDAGNSRIKWALVEAHGRPLIEGTLSHACAEADAPALAGLPAPRSAWLSNVAGAALGERLHAWVEQRWPGLPQHTIRSREQQCGVRNGYREPARLGTDRWAALIGARAAYPDEDLLIATFGTATTLERLDADGYFRGGLIAPGWSLMLRSLGEHAAQLPMLNAEAAPRAPATLDAALANDTANAIVEGCRAAQAGLIERAWRACATPLRCVLAGGAVDQVGPALTIPFTRHDNLVLAGLFRIAADASG